MILFILRFLLLAAALCSLATAQTAISLQLQARDIDFTGAQFTKPFKSGTALPDSCSVGEFFLRSDGIPGRNLYGCVAANIWMLYGSSSSTAVPDVSGPGVLTNDGVTTSWKAIGGDLSGSADNLTLQSIQGRAISGGSPADGQALIWNQSTQRWEPRAVPLTAGTNTWTGKQIFEPSPVQVLSSTTPISPTRSVVQVSLTADTIISAVPLISAGAVIGSEKRHQNRQDMAAPSIPVETSRWRGRGRYSKAVGTLNEFLNPRRQF